MTSSKPPYLVVSDGCGNVFEIPDLWIGWHGALQLGSAGRGNTTAVAIRRFGFTIARIVL